MTPRNAGDPDQPCAATDSVARDSLRKGNREGEGNGQGHGEGVTGWGKSKEIGKGE